MKKSKFKSVKVKHFGGVELICKTMFDFQNVWQGTLNNWDYFRFSEDTIETYPELFEVEKAEREFEDGAYYKVRFQGCLNYEVALCRINPANGLFTFTIPDYLPQYKDAFQEIGEKIELKDEL